MFRSDITCRHLIFLSASKCITLLRIFCMAFISFKDDPAIVVYNEGVASFLGFAMRGMSSPRVKIINFCDASCSPGVPIVGKGPKFYPDLRRIRSTISRK